MNDRVAIVTGSSSGLGAAAARELARRGWRLVINYSKNLDAANTVAADCPGAIVVQADVGDDAQCRKLAQVSLDAFGRIDALVNNVGATKQVPHDNLDGLDADDFLFIYRMNVVSSYQMTRACAPALKAARGAIVNVSSGAARVGTGSSIAYAASKAALNTMTMSLARVLAPEVRVNAVCPGYTETPWHISAHGPEKAALLAERYAARAPLKQAGDPQDLAQTIAWLIEGARQVTGATIYSDSGMHIATP